MNRPSAPSFPGGRPPDLLVVVMDCARESDFRPGTDPVSEMRFSSQLAQRSIVFSRTVAPGSWTVPSHASLFTGLYPWEHRLHSRGVGRLPGDLPRLAGELSDAGYRTLSLAANPFICDQVGLTDGFQQAGWGGWWEMHLRHLQTDRPPDGRDLRTSQPPFTSDLSQGRFWPAVSSLSRRATRYPWLLTIGNELGWKLTSADQDCPLCVSSWVDRTLARWLSTVPPSQPVFVFVNLMEAHEPYLIDPKFGGPVERWRAGRVRQDFAEWLDGRPDWAPSPHQAATWSALYRDSIRHLDHRIERIVRTFQGAGRWDETALVLTSDHGQRTGESGWLGHGMGVEESLVRIPMWLRLPHDENGGTVSRSWASLVDVRPTLLNLARQSPEGACSGVDLRTLEDGPRDGPVWVMSDGVLWAGRTRERLSPTQRHRYDRVLLAGYQGEVRTEFDGAEELGSAYELEGARESQLRPLPTSRAPAAGMIAYASRLARSVVDVDPSHSDSIWSRIESWGYG